MDSITIGFVSAFVTEVLKFVPFLRQNAITQAITAIVVIAVTTFFTTKDFSATGLITSVVAALGSYKAIVQPVAASAGFTSQS